MLAQIMHTLALVRFWRANLANIRSNLADLFLIPPQNFDLAGFGIDFKRDAVGRWNLHRMGITDIQHQVFTTHVGAIAHAIHFQHPGKAGTHTGYHILN